MAYILFNNRVLARARNAASVAEIRTWGVAELFAALSTSLHGMLSEVVRSGVWNNRFADAMQQSDGSPHFVYRNFGKETALYVVCISSPGADAALSKVQYSWAEQHPQQDIWLLPCVVQHLRQDYARIAADRFVILRADGTWSQDDDARQFLPTAMRTPHWLGSAALLKLRNMVREVANNGLQIYPYIAGVAHSKHLPLGVELRCYGDGSSPTIVAVLQNTTAEPAAVLWADFYADTNPVQELEVCNVTGETIVVTDAYGREYQAVCAELQMFPGCILPRMHLRCAVNLPADTFAYSERKERCYIRKHGAEVMLRAEVLAVQRVQCCGMSGYCLQAAYDAAVPNLYFNVYVFEHLLVGKLPQTGDYIEVAGKLMLTPDALVQTEACWAAEPLPLPVPSMPPMEALAQAFADAGYKPERIYRPLYRFGRPDLHLRTPQGNKLFVLVDFVVDGAEDYWGYRRRFYPKGYPAHMARNAQGEGPAALCFVTLHLNTAAVGDMYELKASFHGTPVDVKLPERLGYAAPAVPLSGESQAAALLESAMNSRDFSALISYLREDLYYSSETAEITLHSKTDFLRHMRGRFDQWAKLQPSPEVRFHTALVKYEGVNRMGLAAYQDGELVSVTIFELAAGCISRMMSLAAQSVRVPEAPNPTKS